MTQIGKIENLYRYPVKGLAGEPTEQLTLSRDLGVLGDRALALTRQTGLFNASAEKPLPKTQYLMLMKDAVLAEFQPSYNVQTGMLTLLQNGAVVLDVCVFERQGCAKVETFLKTQIGDNDLHPELVSTEKHMFSDTGMYDNKDMYWVSIINNNSVTALGDAIGQNVDHRRFRGNIHISGMPAWEELALVGKIIQIGNCKLKVTLKTERCAATQVNPKTTKRDINIPFALRKNFGHLCMGIYAEILEGGIIDSSLSVTLIG